LEQYISLSTIGKYTVDDLSYLKFH